jgi:uncharacterized RDD family membrane protein YckC
MHLDDRLSIDTPEGLSIEVTLAGLGSRFGAALVDVVIQGVLLLILLLALTMAGSTLSGDLSVFLMGVGALALALIVLGYYIVFEALNGGRTPGKAVFGIRVASVDGAPVGLGAVSLRTLMRLVDFLPAAYAVGAIAIVTNSRNQRLGDMVANTVVIRDRVAAPPPVPLIEGRALGWDVSSLNDAELGLVRRFAARRHDLASDARHRLASDLATRLRPRVAGGDRLGDEEFLLQVLVEKGARR